MTVTDEPGVYLTDKFGVRIENMMLVKSLPPTLSQGGKDHFSFLQLEPLTLCPIDTTPLDLTLMTAEEREWLNQYHAHVCVELLPLLTDEEDKQWLINATKPI